MGRGVGARGRGSRRGKRVVVAIFGVVACAGRECVFSVMPDADRVVLARWARSPLARTGPASVGRPGASRPARRGLGVAPSPTAWRRGPRLGLNPLDA